MIELALYLVGLSAAAFMAFNIGANDAANPVDTAVGAGALTLRKALTLFSVFTIVGALIQGSFVIKTIGRGIVPEIDTTAALTAVVASGTWIFIATLMGLPISTSQSISGAVIGIGIAYSMLGVMRIEDINWGVISRIMLSWIMSPTLAMSLAILLYTFFVRLERSLRGRYDVDRIFLYLHIASLAFAAYAFGANDVANATGVYLTITQKYLGMPDHETMMFLALLGGLFIAIGGFTLGERVIRTTAFKITKLDHPSGVAAGFSLALIVWLFTTIPYILWGFGMPISTTHTSVSSIMGVGIAKVRSLRGLNLKVTAYIITSWLLTVPIAMIMAIGLYMMVRLLL
ncbi:MAG: anion permease [Candidatus Nezhaarchaeota archaeon]|nr:anion permease [Candidatus Nezhaarchaeota archaeon]MCX8142432.1 anion permease [Candidatus Nezhaarchaeota archaeon]MDW8050595.1 anion permease [Nitrososphaerota archaeon]